MLHVPGRSSPAAAAAAAVAAAAAGNPRRKRNSNLLLVVGASPPDARVENLVLFAGGRRCATSLTGSRRGLERGDPWSFGGVLRKVMIVFVIFENEKTIESFEKYDVLSLWLG